MSTKNSTNQQGIVHASYFIGIPGILGGVSLTTNLIIDTENRQVLGTSQVFQSINPPLDVQSNLSGEFTQMTVMHGHSRILLTATGYPKDEIWVLVMGAPTPLFPANLKLRMVLEEDWKKGIATYSYRDAEGNMVEMKNIPVIATNVSIVEIPEEAAVAQ